MDGSGIDNGFTSVDQMLRVYPAFLFGTPLGIIGLCASAVMMVMTLVGQRIIWVWIALTIYLTSLGVALVETSYGTRELANPLLPIFEQLRNLNRPVALFMLVMLTLRAGLAQTRVRMNVVGASTKAFFAFEICTCLVLFSGGSSATRGVFGLIVFVLIFLSFGIGLGRWLVGPEQAYTALRTILGVCVLLIFGVICHILFKPSSAYLAGRLTGTTANPQFMGAFLAFMLPTCYGLLLKRNEPPVFRIAAGCALGLSIGFILMSGSRAAVIVAMAGVLVFFRRRLGQFVLTSLVAVIVLIAAMQLLGINDSFSAHLFSTDNSRANVWGRLWSEFLAHPLFGAGAEQKAGESSYLSVLAVYGLFCAVPFVIAIFLILRDSVRIVRRRPQLGEHAVLADIAVASIAGILISGVFDNHLLASLSPAVFLIYMLLSIYTLLLDPKVFTKATDSPDLNIQVIADPFGDVFNDDPIDPIPATSPFGEAVDHIHRW